VIRHGCERTEVAAGFDLKSGQDAAKWLQAHDCSRRRMPAAARGRARQGLEGIHQRPPVPVQMLRELGELLVDVHASTNISRCSSASTAPDAG